MGLGIKKSGVDVNPRSSEGEELNLVEGANITITATESTDPTTNAERIDVTIAATGGSGSSNLNQIEVAGNLA